MTTTARSTTDTPAHTNGRPSPTPSAKIPSQRITCEQLDALAARVALADGEREWAEVEQPFTGTLLGWVPRCSEDDVAVAFERARAAQSAWARTPFAERKRIFLRYHDMILDRQAEALDMVQLESGKARRHAFEEILDVAITARYYANTGERYLRAERRQGMIPLLTETWEYRHPVGVVGVISPWNYPLTLGVSDALAAIMAGNGIVIKPDSQTPFSALWGFAALEEAGLPRGLVQVVTGSGSELGPPMIDRADYMMFTGSTATGRKIAGAAGEHLIGASMELGGKNAMIVLDDANLGRAAEGAERALFSNSGQLCISIERLMVHESVADEFERLLLERVRKMKLGTDLDYGADMGSLISAEQLETVKQHVDDAVEKGARVLTGGRARPEIGPYFFEPTLLREVGDGMTLYRDETFGPVVAVSRFSTEDEAIRRANDSDYGLNFSVWTRDTRRGRRVATRLQAGTVNVNEAYAAAWASLDAPMGGMKASGLGRRHGAHGIQKYTEEQTIAIQKLLPLGPPPMVSQRMFTWGMIQGLRLLRRLPGVK